MSIIITSYGLSKRNLISDGVGGNYVGVGGNYVYVGVTVHQIPSLPDYS